MASTFDDEMRVTFPASSGFSAIGKVAAAGLAFRLGFDVAQVESLRNAVDRATTALQGTSSITLIGRWNDACLVLELSNPAVQFSPEQTEELTEASADVVTTFEFAENTIVLTVRTH